MVWINLAKATVSALKIIVLRSDSDGSLRKIESIAPLIGTFCWAALTKADYVAFWMTLALAEAKIANKTTNILQRIFYKIINCCVR